MDLAKSNSIWTDLSGRLNDVEHTLPVRVYFEDTDFSGLVYHTAYMRWCERGRSDFLRMRGIAHTALYDGTLTGEASFFAVRRLKAEYLKPARIDDVLEVHTITSAVTKATIVLGQTIERDGEPLFQLEAQCVLLSLAGRPLRLPPPLLALLSPPKSS